jgi:hypothetical protein
MMPFRSPYAAAVQVLLVLGKDRRCVWGSLFLDHNGEEDRNLRRGKVRG